MQISIRYPEMGSTAGSAKFISRKVSCVRWQPSGDSARPESGVVAVGSWDDSHNTLGVWGVGSGEPGVLGQVSSMTVAVTSTQFYS